MRLSNVAVVIRLLKRLRPFWFRAVLAVLAAVATAFSTIGLMGLSALLIQKASLRPPILVLTTAIVGVRFFGISRAVCRYLDRLLTHDVVLRILADLRRDVVSSLVSSSNACADLGRGQTLNRIIDDTESIQGLYVKVLSPTIVGAVTTIFAAGIFATMLPWAGALLFVGMSVVTVGVSWLAWKLTKRSARAAPEARAQLTVDILEIAEGADELAMAGRTNDWLARFEATETEIAQRESKQAWFQGCADTATTLVSGLTLVALIWVTTIAIGEGTVPGIILGVLALMSMAAFDAISGVPAAIAESGTGLESARRILELLDADKDSDPSNPQALDVSTTPAISLRSISARYTPDGPTVLNGLSLDLAPGAKVALVGQSGAGKTSLARVLVRFLDIESGGYSLTEYPIADFKRSDVRRCIGLVSQDSHVFHTSIYENIRLAKPDATELAITNLVAQVGLNDWIQTLPDGIHTVVGHDGNEMSGGQRQRLLLARALLADFPVLILDEPTAGIDRQSALGLMTDLVTSRPDKTILVITHDLVGETLFDTVYRMQEGQLSETADSNTLSLAD